MSFERARAVADAVLFEGYVLYPYRASAPKNRARWQFGVVAPRAYAEASGSDPWSLATVCLVEGPGGVDRAGERRPLRLVHGGLRHTTSSALALLAPRSGSGLPDRGARTRWG